MKHNTTVVPTTEMIESYEELITSHLSRRESQDRDEMLCRLAGEGQCPNCGNWMNGDPQEVAAFNHAMSQLLYRGRIRLREDRTYELSET